MVGKRTAIVVPGHGDVDPEGRHRITRRCLRLVHEAERLVTAGGADVVVFSGWSSTGGPSEAEQMRDLWSGPDVELVVEPTARNTAENALRTLPLLRERGIERAVVVCTPTHLVRTRLLFGRLYRGAGLEVAFRTVAVAPSLRSIAWEVAAFPFLPAQLRAARAELARRSR
ncbi:MAG TPA: YdcF family protein [Gaiellaceae bacterium]|nr:YdcF family protein [Gaiellaceae bacterium]